MKRKIAAILAADAAEYSRLVAEDEEETLRQLVASVAVFKESIEAHGGRIFNTAGDAVLAEFQSAVEAVRSAISIQETLKARNADYAPNRRMLFRMGISIGDVVENDGDLLGDGVNIAARLQTLAQPGGLAVSRWVQEQVAGKVTAEFRDAGHQLVRNMPSPIHVFKSSAPGAPAAEQKSPPKPASARSAWHWRFGGIAAGLAVTVASVMFALPMLYQPAPLAVREIALPPSGQEGAPASSPAAAPQSPPQPTPTPQQSESPPPDRAAVPAVPQSPPQPTPAPQQSESPPPDRADAAAVPQTPPQPTPAPHRTEKALADRARIPAVPQSSTQPEPAPQRAESTTADRGAGVSTAPMFADPSLLPSPTPPAATAMSEPVPVIAEVSPPPKTIPSHTTTVVFPPVPLAPRSASPGEAANTPAVSFQGNRFPQLPIAPAPAATHQETMPKEANAALPPPSLQPQNRQPAAPSLTNPAGTQIERPWEPSPPATAVTRKQPVPSETINAALPPAPLEPVPTSPADRSLSSGPGSVVPQYREADKSFAPPAADQKSGTEPKPQKVQCADILERAQLGELTSDDRAFLRSKCR